MEHLEHQNVIAVENETSARATRATKEGKHFTYCMNVLQQPERARACGAGAKSSADRRPVDPPPIVELKIFDGENTDRDVTFNMDANYFLFATLEQARPIAQGRVPEDKTRTATVLTGTPVAGMVYLDRPSPAGYFIFPDLSVRHEGKYRLSFSLYEELKHDKDCDKGKDLSRPVTPDNQHVTHRLEVKSKPFTVYSAKKFPGLTESTHLSRMVAEQGCRVRIRRDVRMRRRDTKKEGHDWDAYDDATAEQRARVSSTPEIPSAYPSHSFMDPMGRPRSPSNGSLHSLANPVARRTSLQELNQGFGASLGTAPHTPQNAYGPTSPYGPSPSQQYSQPPFLQQQAMRPPPPQYNGQHGYSLPPPMSALSTAQPPFGFYAPAAPPAPSGPAPYTQPTAGHSATASHRLSMDYPMQPHSDDRRPSMQYVPASSAPSQPGQAHSGQPYPSQQHHAYQPPSPPQSAYGVSSAHRPSYVSQDSYSRPPPPQPVQPPARASGANTPLGARSHPYDHRMPLPPLQMPRESNKLEPSSPVTAVPSSARFSSVSNSADSGKRSFGNTFPTTDRHLSQPMRQGARPTSPYIHPAGYGAFDSEQLGEVDGDECITRKCAYKRANGEAMTRVLPSGYEQYA